MPSLNTCLSGLAEGWLYGGTDLPSRCSSVMQLHTTGEYHTTYQGLGAGGKGSGTAVTSPSPILPAGKEPWSGNCCFRPLCTFCPFLKKAAEVHLLFGRVEWYHQWAEEEWSAAYNNTPLHGECQPRKVQQKHSSTIGCLNGRRLWRTLSNHQCAYK